MKRKKESKIFKTYPVRDEMGDERVILRNEPHSVTPLPKGLDKPLLVDTEHWTEEYFYAAKHPVSLPEFEAGFTAHLESLLRSRWEDLLSAYKVTVNSQEGWKHFALELARDYVPGVSVKLISPAIPKPRVMNREHIEALVNHVQKKLAEMRAGKSSRSAKVTEGAALRAVYKDWPPELGRKRRTFKSFEVHYYQCKRAYAPPLSIEALGRSDYKTANG